MGCSKCNMEFKTGSFGEKVEYSDHICESWPVPNKNSRAKGISKIQRAKTREHLEKKFGILCYLKIPQQNFLKRFLAKRTCCEELIVA